MKLSSLELSFLLTSSVTADFLTARSLNHDRNVELGELQDVQDFYATLEQSSFCNTQNGSFVWEDITEFETLDDIDNSALELAGPNLDRGHSLVSREDQCTELTGITRMICDNMPSRWTFWAFGGPLIIYYAPRLMTNWLNKNTWAETDSDALQKDIAVAIQAGRNLRRVWRDGSSGANGLTPHDELRRTLNMKAREDAVDYHFSLPYLLDRQGRPEANSWSLSRRSGDSEGVDLAMLSHDYVFSETDQVLYYKGTRGTFSFGVPEGKDKSPSRNNTLELEARAPTHDYTIVMSVIKRSTANTIAKPSCIAKLLKFHIDRSSETNRFACRPIDNKGKWHATMHLMINRGKRNRGTARTCCD
ncbi:predicted protein [Aspergillus nidulans FGSC A4]|uniref:Uncharacterized protein n=1 Tax=Emericella nidulans (strain FGSC A4 / ATCC 38163 / CBS 112.46 / NRRL 194 / M139) TaxID=227321 RepID=Q5B1W3_EMENI|nr:hypothetical protein [Aspergillus nidulans FGSC A4]EAA62627.1 predicted protein [Aspergillus nidulans FGSC A4]CBF81857.1 TPA: conserved hypothetical protein [Aspergillus nidulans FGSC A4]|eukprot:XP_663071.1 predicted protein [Aspergillus nidulans FGSC A4]